MNHNTVPAWDDRDELLRALSGDWQSFAQPPSQRQLRQLTEYVCGGLLEYRFGVEVTVSDDPQRVFLIWVVVSGDYGHHLVPFVKRTINNRLPPGTAEKTRRRSWDLRRTARGEWFVEDGFPMAELTLQPPALRVSDARWEERVEQASGDADGENHVAGHGNPDVVEYQGLQLDLQTRRLSKVGEDTGVELSVVQVAILKLFFKNRESWVNGDVIEDAINHAKTKPGKPPYRSEDTNLVGRHLVGLRKALTQFRTEIANNRLGEYRINPTSKLQDGDGSGKK